MLALIALYCQQPQIDVLNQLAKDRDVTALTKYLADEPKRNPFSVLKTGGAYAAGRLGWTAKSLATPDGANYVVFSTPLIEEDMGELLFRARGDGKLAYVQESDSMGVQLDSHNFDIRFDLRGGKLIATDQLTCHWTSKSHGKHFVFRISPTYTVRSLRDERGEDVPFIQAGGIVAVTPGNRALKFVASYDGTNLMPAFDRLISEKEATLSGSVWYLSVARQPAPYDITIHCSPEWSALAQGDLVSSTVVGNDRITKFHNSVPVIWYGASAGPYKTIVDTIGGREYAVMSAEMSEEDMHLQNYFNSEVVEFYSKSFVAYPFKRWTALDSWQFHGGPGALEAYSFATYPGGLPGLDSHEPSHTWWGGLINNNYLSSLWNEGFAVFSSGFYARNQPHGNAAEMAKAFVSVPQPFPGFDSVPMSESGVDVGPMAAALGYGKGGYVLQMLEDELGTDLMTRCMREWIKASSGKVGGWPEFEYWVNQVSKKNYKWFFDQWVRTPGYANCSLEGVRWSNNVLNGTVRFKGDTSYRFTTDILIEFSDGRRVFDRVAVTPNGNDTGSFTMNVTAAPTLVVLDPWQKLLRTHDRSETRMTLDQNLFRLKAYVDPGHTDFLKPFGFESGVQTLPTDPAGILFIGSPVTTPMMAELCKAAGFQVDGHTLTYDGTKVDLDHGGALALVDLPGRKVAAVGLGKIIARPDLGNSRLILFNEYGQAIRAVTDPITSGSLAWRPTN